MAGRTRRAHEEMIDMRRLVTLTLAGVLAAMAARGLVWYRRLQRITAPAKGTFPNGMAYAHIGTGPKTLLFLRGGTGVPFGRVIVALSAIWMGPFLADGYTIWTVARKRGMPKGYRMEDMARDTAALIRSEFGGRVDLVLGEEALGGMTAFCLAAHHPETFGHLAVMLAGHRLSEDGQAFEREFARLQSEGRTSKAGALVVRRIAPGLRVPGLYPVLGTLLMRTMMGETYPEFPQDVVVEAEAVSAFDGRAFLPGIVVPVLLIGCDRDFEFPKAVYEETARMIPDCTLRLYEGKTGPQAGSDKRLPQDVLEFVRRHGGNPRSQAEPAGSSEATPMRQTREEIVIDAPVEHVWALFRDTSRWKDWMPRGEFSDFSGPIDEVGTTYVESMRLLGFEMKATATVVEVEPLRLYHERADTGPMEAYFRFEPAGDASRMIVESRYQPAAMLPGIVKDLMDKAWVERQEREMLSNFKALAEATVPAHASA